MAKRGESAEEARQAYDAIASLYDAFTESHDYELWLGELLPVLNAYDLPPRGKLLDVACGTGKSFIPMVPRGWSVTGCDISPAMIEIAQAKVSGTAMPVELMVSDMRNLPLLGEFDLVWCLTDALNYLLSAENLASAMRSMARNLRPGGLVAFDVDALLSFRGFFANKTVVEHDGLRLIWTGLGSREGSGGRIACATFEVEPLDLADEEAVRRAARVPREFHKLRLFPQMEVLAALADAGLEVLEVFGHHYDAVFEQPLDEDRHTKAVYVARKPTGM
ncbi:MAG: class I SAM-dependent DNA methyltransferase [Solirubrobacterales bacterium]